MASTHLRRDRYKLASEFGENSVTHRIFKTDLRTHQRRIEVLTTWTTERLLGAGAFGEVRLEREQGTSELRAVKAIPKRQVNTREVEALIDIQDHPALFVGFLGWFEDPYAVHIAMEFIEYGDLGQFIADHGQQAKAGARDIASQILEGLVVLHEREICHRDLKPQNILIASRSPIWVKITDFGIAKNYRDSALRTRCGTIVYQAPEILGLLPREMIGTPQTYTKNVDIWAFGTLVHEVLTSEIPFLECSPFVDSTLDSSSSGLDSSASTPSTACLDMALLSSYCHGQPFPITALEQHQVSTDGIDFVKSLMAANPIDRVSAADALKSSWLAGIPDLDATISGPSKQIPVAVEKVGRRREPASIRTDRAPPSTSRTQSRDPTVGPNRSLSTQSPDRYRAGQTVQERPNSTLRSASSNLMSPPRSPPPSQAIAVNERLAQPLDITPIIQILLLGDYFHVRHFLDMLAIERETVEEGDICHSRCQSTGRPFQLTWSRSMNVDDLSHFSISGGVFAGIVYCHAAKDHPKFPILIIKEFAALCAPNYLRSTAIVLPKGDMALNFMRSIFSNDFSQWSELVNQGARLFMYLESDGIISHIVRQVRV